MKIHSDDGITIDIFNKTLATALTVHQKSGALEIADILNELGAALQRRSGYESAYLSFEAVMEIVADDLNADGRRLVKILAGAIEP